MGLILQEHITEPSINKIREMLVKDRNVVKEMVVTMTALKPARPRELDLCDTIEIGFAR